MGLSVLFDRRLYVGRYAIVHMFLCVAALLANFPAWSGKPNVINFIRNQYRAANKNWSITQDSRGIMYFGNDDGLLEFDGIRWILYRPPEDKVVRAVAVSTKDNRIYSGGYEEFGFWKPNVAGEMEYTSLSKNMNMRNEDVWKICVTDSLVYFQSFRGVYVYDNKTVQTVSPGPGMLFLLKVKNELWSQAIKGSIYRLENGKYEQIPGSEIFSDTEVRVVLPYGEKYLVGTSSKGIYTYDGQEFEYWDTEFSHRVKPYELNIGLAGNNGNYFFGTLLDGIYETNEYGKIINHISAANSLQNNTVLSLYQEASGNLWVAMDRGISYVQYSPHIDFYINPEGKVGAVYAAAMHENKLYLGTNQGVFYLTEEDLATDGTLSKLKFVEGTQGQVWDLMSKDGLLLCGHTKGLKIIEHDKVTDQVKNVTGVYRIQHIPHFGDEYLFLGTYTKANILKREGKTWKTIANTELDEIREPVFNIERDHLGNLWLGHVKKGVYRCILADNMTRLKHIKYYHDKGPRLRMFRIGERVVFARSDSIFVYNDIDDCMTYHEGISRCFADISGIHNIASLSPTRFWAITGSGLYDVNYDGHDSKINSRYDVSYNNLSLVNEHERVIVLNDSTSLVCLDNGFLLHSAERASPTNDSLSIPVFRSITAVSTKSGKTMYLTANEDEAKLPHDYNLLRFDFFSGDAVPRNLYFQTRLAGMEEKWSPPKRICEIRFERLPKGRYTFMLRTTDNSGRYSEPTRFRFSISAPWHLTQWAYAAYFALTALLLVGLWYWWLRQLQNRHILKIRMREEHRLRRRNNELQREIASKNSELFTQTTFIIQKNELLNKVKEVVTDCYRGMGNKAIKQLYEKVDTLLSENMDMDEDWKRFLIKFEQHHTDFFKRLKQEYEELTPNDLNVCACLKLNLSSKDIASLLCISLRGVENSRYRLRKKLNLPPEQNLNEFLMSY